MYLAYALVIGLIVSVAAFLVLSLWGIPVVIVVALALIVLAVTARKRNPDLGTVERGRRVEPTGRTRMGSGGAQPTNDRVGS
jgi:cytochrome c-type biogenesis protein CcmH/NrfF